MEFLQLKKIHLLQTCVRYWDEYILKAIIEKIYPQAIVEQQIKVGKYSMDLKVTLGSKELFIEFDGPSHFAITRFGKPKDVWKKKATVESRTGIEVVKWPYWIQRCEQNVKSLFNSDVKGYGALWSTKTLFGDFYFNDSADIICELNSRFNIPIEDISTFYSPGSDGRVIPEHPILQKIQKGKEPLSRLIPTGTKEVEIWIPVMLRNLI